MRSTRRPRRRTGAGDDAGFASLLAMGMVALLLLAAAVVTVAGSALEARHRAAATADLAALAAAQAVQRYEDGCQAAGLIAAGNGGVLVECRLDGGEVVVAVQIQTSSVLGLRVVPEVVQSARAGPAQP